MKTGAPDDLKRKRKQAKVGMSVALGTLVGTSLLAGSGKAWPGPARTLHLLAGVSLVGFSLWHVHLYTDQKPQQGQRQERQNILRQSRLL